MQKLLLIILAALLSPIASAERLSDRRVIDAAISDWNKDDLPDLAILYSEGELGDALELELYLRDQVSGRLESIVRIPNYSFGTIAGDGGLVALPNGSLLVRTEWAGFGRTRWTHTLTIAHRKEDFVVAGFSYFYFDSIDHDVGADCDYNVLTGSYEVDGKVGRVEPAFVSIEEWEDSMGFSACGLG